VGILTLSDDRHQSKNALDTDSQISIDCGHRSTRGYNLEKENRMKLKDVYILWDIHEPSVKAVPKTWFKGIPEHKGMGFKVPTKEDLANPAAFLLREFLSMIYDVHVRPDAVTKAFLQIEEFHEFTYDLAGGDIEGRVA
jgi:hypothetical protein